MTIGDVSSAASATQFSVKLTKSQEDQQAIVVNKLIDSTEASAPKAQGVGGRLNVVG